MDRYLTITRCDAINEYIDGDCPGSVCHSPGLAQRNLLSQHEKDIRGLSDRVWLKRSLEFFDFRKFELKRYISEKTAMFKLENREKHNNN